MFCADYESGIKMNLIHPGGREINEHEFYGCLLRERDGFRLTSSYFCPSRHACYAVGCEAFSNKMKVFGWLKGKYSH
ncbi:hypothetical protein KFK09_025912 [Dendrobium nobile]|uniref:Uncharacterized protein n=1 Tax=Dendrobium nobile TaxID=94219 RepID=A0A8T3A771_DENNO|nr:hypothetical protein KFK09_025912 [Dendrobium nobile]